MDRPEALAKEWAAEKFRCAYYFLGEPAFVAEMLERLKAALKPDAFNFTQWSGELDSQARDIVSDALTSPVFAPRRLVIVNNPKMTAHARAEFVRYLERPLETTTIVFLSDDKKVDAKDSLAKAVESRGSVCLLQPLREEEALRRLHEKARQAGKPMSEDAAAFLVAEAGTDWAILQQELDKVVLFVGAAPAIERDHALQCLGYQKSLDPFALVRLVQDRALKESLAHLKKMFDSGKPDDQAFRALNQITGAVSKQFRAKRLLKTGMSVDALFKSLRLHSYYDRDYPAALKKFSEERLRLDMERCLETEVALKSKAWLDARMEIEHLIVALCRKGRNTRGG